MTKLTRLAAWAALAAIVLATVCPIGLRPHDILPVNADRMLAFAALGGLFTLAYPRHWAIVALFVVLSAFAIEYLQELSPSRHARLEDAALKALGAATGAMITLAPRLLRRGLSLVNRRRMLLRPHRQA